MRIPLRVDAGSNDPGGTRSTMELAISPVHQRFPILTSEPRAADACR